VKGTRPWGAAPCQRWSGCHRNGASRTWSAAADWPRAAMYAPNARSAGARLAPRAREVVGSPVPGADKNTQPRGLTVELVHRRQTAALRRPLRAYRNVARVRGYRVRLVLTGRDDEG